MQHLVKVEGQDGYARRTQWMGPCAALLRHGCICERPTDQAFPSLPNRCTLLACLGRRPKRPVRTCRALILLRPWHCRQSGQQASVGVGQQGHSTPVPFLQHDKKEFCFCMRPGGRLFTSGVRPRPQQKVPGRRHHHQSRGVHPGSLAPSLWLYLAQSPAQRGAKLQQMLKMEHRAACIWGGRKSHHMLAVSGPGGFF